MSENLGNLKVINQLNESNMGRFAQSNVYIIGLLGTA